MPTNPDRDPTHISSETHPDSSGVCVHGSRHPLLPSAAVTLARACSGVPANATAEQVTLAPIARLPRPLPDP